MSRPLVERPTSRSPQVRSVLLRWSNVQPKRLCCPLGLKPSNTRGDGLIDIAFARVFRTVRDTAYCVNLDVATAAINPLLELNKPLDPQDCFRTLVQLGSTENLWTHARREGLFERTHCR